MKITLIATFSPPITGQSVACDLLLENLKSEKNISVKVINFAKPDLVNNKFPILRIFRLFLMNFEIFFKARKSDIIYFTPSESYLGNLKDILIYILLLGRLNKTFVHIHGGMGFKNLIFKNYFLRKINLFFLKKFKRILVLSKFHQNTFAEQGLTKLSIVKNFADKNIFYNDLAQEKQNTNVSYISNFISSKGYECVLKAALLNNNPNIFFHFAGKFETEIDEKIFLEKIKSKSNIIYHGVVADEQKINLFKLTDIFVLPTNYPYEGQPISILEGYASSCAVITCAHSGIPDIFSDEVNGYYITFNDSNRLLMRIYELHNDVELLASMKVTNFNYACEHFTTKIHLNSIREALEIDV